MVEQNPAKRIVSLEGEILRALCSGAESRAEHAAAMRELASHAWREAEHRIVFEAIQRLGNMDAELLRAELPAQATRMGFPDVSWEKYFGSEVDEEKNLGELVRQLTACEE